MVKTHKKLLSCALVLVFGVLAILGAGQWAGGSAATALQENTRIDLIANLTVANQGVAGQPFEARAEIQSIGENAADGAGFILEFAPGTGDLALECESVSGGATCPVELEIIQATETERGGVIGIVPNLPVRSKIVLKVTGTYTLLNSTATTSLRVVAPDNTVDTDPNSNQSVQNTSLTKLPAKVKITKTQDREIVNSGEPRVYTVTYENTGSSPATVAISDGYYAGIDDTIGGSRPGMLSGPAKLSFSIECGSESTVICPDELTGEKQETTGLYGQSTSVFALPRDHGEDTYTESSEHLNLPAGKKLVLEVTVVQTLESCINGADFVAVYNVASYTEGLSAGVEIEPSDSSVLGFVRGEECPKTTIRVTKSQNKAIVDSGEERVYTVSYENTGSHDVVAHIRDQYSGESRNVTVDGIQGGNLLGDGSVSYRIFCDSDSTIQCPSAFDGREGTYKVGSGDREFFNSTDQIVGYSFYPYVRDFQHVTIPAGEKLVLRIPVVQTLQGCIDGGEYLGVSNEAQAHRTSGSAASFEPAIVPLQGLVKGEKCQNTTVKVTKTQDREVVASGETRTYTVTYENTGSYPALVSMVDQYNISQQNLVGDRLTTNLSGRADLSYRIYCDESSTMTCPDVFNGAEYKSWLRQGMFEQLFNNSNQSFYVPQPNYKHFKYLTIPAGKKLVLQIPVVMTLKNCTSGYDYVGIYSTANARAATGSKVFFAYNSAYVYGAVTCNDVSSITDSNASNFPFGDPMTFSSKITNAVGKADQLAFSQVLPKRAVLSPEQMVRAGLIGNPAEAFRFSCFVGSGANADRQPVSCPADLRYDPEKHAITGTHREPITGGKWFEVVTETFAGFVAAPSASFEIKTVLGEVPGDTNTSFNNSSKTFELTNTTAPMDAIHTLNIPAPADIQLTGKLYCDYQGSETSQQRGYVTEYQATIPRGSDTATSLVHNGYWLNDNCRLLVDRDDPPPGYVWADEDTWPTERAPEKTRITGPETWRFQLQLAPAPPPRLPLTGGTAAITYTLIGAGVGAAAVASAIWRNRAMRRREESRQAV